MEHVAINYLAVVAGAVAYVALGALWYSPVLFASAWMRGIGKTKEQVTAGPCWPNYLFALIAGFLASYGIARIMSMTGRIAVADGIIFGLLAGICFVVATMGINDIFEKRPKILTAINVLYHLMGFLIIGIINGVWR